MKTTTSTLCTTGIARRTVAAGLAFALTCSLAACGATTGESVDATDGAAAGTSQQTTSGSVRINYLDTADMFTDRDTDASYDEAAATTISLADEGSTVEGTGASVDGSTVTIGSEGTYVVSGELTDGRLVVDAEGAKVQVVLDGARISTSGASALYVRDADKVFVTLADGTENVLAATGADETTDERNLDGAIYSAETTVINGSGILSVTSAQGHGIVVKDDLKLCVGKGGELAAEAATGSAIQAKDSVRVTGDGSYRLEAGTDGVHVEYDEDDADTAGKGYIYVDGGTFGVTAGSDGFDASYIMQVDGGSIAVKADDDGLHAEADLVVTGGTIDVTECYEGLEGARVGVDGGTISVVASDDGFNATGDDNENTTGDLAWGGMVPGGAAGDAGTLDTTADDGAAADGATADGATADGGMPQGEPPALADGEASEMPEGMELPSDGEVPAGKGARTGNRPTGMPGSDTGSSSAGDADAADDAPALDATQESQGNATATRGNRGGNRGGMGGGMMEVDDSALIQITGGTINVAANGDGIDSNGTIVMSGGTLMVDGPESTGNGALDSGTTITVTGGTIYATSSGGMEEMVTADGSTVPSLLAYLDSTTSGAVTLTDASGSEVARFEPSKRYNAVIIVSDKLSADGTYTLTAGDQTVDVEMTGTVTTVGTASGMGMGGAQGMGGMRGQGAPTGDASGSADAQGVSSDGGADADASTDGLADGSAAQGMRRGPRGGNGGNGGPHGQRRTTDSDNASATVGGDTVTG